MILPCPRRAPFRRFRPVRTYGNEGSGRHYPFYDSLLHQQVSAAEEHLPQKWKMTT